MWLRVLCQCCCWDGNTRALQTRRHPAPPPPRRAWPVAIFPTLHPSFFPDRAARASRRALPFLHPRPPGLSLTPGDVCVAPILGPVHPLQMRAVVLVCVAGVARLVLAGSPWPAEARQHAAAVLQQMELADKLNLLHGYGGGCVGGRNRERARVVSRLGVAHVSAKRDTAGGFVCCAGTWGTCLRTPSLACRPLTWKTDPKVCVCGGGGGGGWADGGGAGVRLLSREMHVGASPLRLSTLYALLCQRCVPANGSCRQL